QGTRSLRPSGAPALFCLTQQAHSRSPTWEAALSELAPCEALRAPAPHNGGGGALPLQQPVAKCPLGSLQRDRDLMEPRRPARLVAGDKCGNVFGLAHRKAPIPDPSEGEPPGRSFAATRRVGRVLGDCVS